MPDLRRLIRSIPDFPKKGVVFRDITTLLKDSQGFRQAVELLAEPYRSEPIDHVVSIEARGFIFGGAVAYVLGCGLIPARKPGKLPAETSRSEYELEYGTDAIEMHRDAIRSDDRVLIVDDLLATGGTALAACKLVEGLGGDVAGVIFLIELSFLKGRDRLAGYPVRALIDYQSEEER